MQYRCLAEWLAWHLGQVVSLGGESNRGWGAFKKINTNRGTIPTSRHGSGGMVKINAASPHNQGIDLPLERASLVVHHASNGAMIT